MSAHRAPSARLLAPGGDDRASGPRSHHLLARQRYFSGPRSHHLLARQRYFSMITNSRRVRRLRCPPPPAACSRCVAQPAALLPPPGIGNAAERVSEPIPLSQCSAGSCGAARRAACFHTKACSWLCLSPTTNTKPGRHTCGTDALDSRSGRGPSGPW